MISDRPLHTKRIRVMISMKTKIIYFQEKDCRKD